MRIKIIRILSFLIDVLIIMLPVQIVMIGIIGVQINQLNMLFSFLFAVYGTLFCEYMNGATPGKYFGKIAVIDRADVKPTIMYLGMRELIKGFYFTPWIGWILALVSLLMLFVNGNTLHDIAGQTKVVSAQRRKYLLSQKED